MPIYPEFEVTHLDNRIVVKGSLRLGNFQRVMAALHQTTQRLGYKDITLDFSQCVAAFAGAMLGVCSQVIALRARGTEVFLDLPVIDKLNKLFRNSNWAHLIDPASYDASTFQGHTHVPATRFTSPTEQQTAVNAIIEVVLGSLTGIDRSDFAAIEWSLNEITDNVLTHARTDTGGLVQVTTFERTRRRVEFIVCDAGASIPLTLRETHREISSDAQALERAIREGITRDTSVGQGNGLFGTFQVCRVSSGYFQIHSRYASLDYDGKRGLQFKTEQIPYSGTLVAVCIDCSKPGILQNALKFGGEQYIPTDLIEIKYETISRDIFQFVLHDEASSFGSRLAGEPVRNKLVNLVRMSEGRRVVVDFRGVPLVSSSFADEVFGKLFVELGPTRFMRAFEFTSISDTVRSLIDKAISQRMATKQ
jgi:anti-anti-sigma regulatory factor/anti-sigma regulatory factor (Ser/Thr protein kinase)